MELRSAVSRCYGLPLVNGGHGGWRDGGTVGWRLMERMDAVYVVPVNGR